MEYDVKFHVLERKMQDVDVIYTNNTNQTAGNLVVYILGV